MNPYFFLSFFLGFICKLYDDLYDNNMYDYYNIEKKNIPYVEAFLKTLFVIGFVLLSLYSIDFFSVFYFSNIIGYLFKPSDYEATEFTFFFASILLMPFLNWKYYWNNKMNIFNVIMVIILSGMVYYVIDYLTGCTYQEFSNKKLIVRGLFSFFIIAFLSLNYLFPFLNQNLIIIILFGLAYLITSCYFQYTLLSNEKKTDKKKIKEKKKKLMKKSKKSK